MRLLLLLCMVFPAYADSNIVHIEQVGSNAIYTVQQDGTGHRATIIAGQDSSQDSSTVSITQQGPGAKIAKVELPAGYNNGISIAQDGAGQHYTGIMSFTGSANNITVNQSGSSNNMFNLIGSGTNNGNTVNVTQTGNAGADKSFTLNMTSTYGATVSVQQTNMTTANSGSMTINCSSSCGTYSYIRN